MFIVRNGSADSVGSRVSITRCAGMFVGTRNMEESRLVLLNREHRCSVNLLRH